MVFLFQGEVKSEQERARTRILPEVGPDDFRSQAFVGGDVSEIVHRGCQSNIVEVVALQELVAEHIGERYLAEGQIVALGDVERVGSSLVAAVCACESERTVGAVGSAHMIALAVAQVGITVVARYCGDVALLVPCGRCGCLV